MTNFVELELNEKIALEGGINAFTKAAIKKTLLGAIVLYAVENWATTKQAISDGIQDGMKTWN